MQTSVELKPSTDWARVEKMVLEDPEGTFSDANSNAHDKELFIIELNEDAVGFVLLGFWNGEDDTAVEVSKFFVCPQLRGKSGISLLAAKEVFSMMSKRKYRSYSLQSANDKASHFWRKALHGMNFQQEDKLFMVWNF